jgi:outer membrane protein TolC
VKSGIRAANINEVRSTTEVAITASNVITSVRKAYLNVLITQAQLQLKEQSLKRNQQALRDARCCKAASASTWRTCGPKSCASPTV